MSRPIELSIFRVRNSHTHRSGGPAGLVYGFLVACVGTLSVFTTLGELASMYVLRRFCCIFFEADKRPSARAPTSGGQYHWVAMLAPPSCRNFLSYITGTRRIATYWTARWADSPHFRMAHCRRLASSRRIRGIPLRNTDPSTNYIKPPII